MRQNVEREPVTPPGAQENGVTQVLVTVVGELKTSINREIIGTDLLYDLLNAPWFRSLLQVYECLQEHLRRSPLAHLSCASGLSQQVMADLRDLAVISPEAEELHELLAGAHLQALLSTHDMVAQKDYAPILPAVPDSLPNDEEAMRVVCMVKNNQPLGATIRRDDLTGEIYVARVIHGGLADRSGLLNVGDRLVEVNWQPVDGMEPEEIIQILANCRGTIHFKLIPKLEKQADCQPTLFVRATVDYDPYQDPGIPCADAGVSFLRGDVLEIVDQTDALWWQARKLPSTSGCAGLIPSADQLRRKQKESYWLQSVQTLSWFETLRTIDNEEDLMSIDEKCVETDEEVFESEELKDDSEFSSEVAGIFLAGFRRSLRLCRRKIHCSQQQSPHPFCHSSAPCPGLEVDPYTEVVLHQRGPRDRHRLVVLVGPSGVGVSELCRRLMEAQPGIFRGPVPHTTRPPKTYEEPGREYHFISKELFDSMVDSQRFLEYGTYKGYQYGTSFTAITDVLDKGLACVVDIDPRAIQLVKTQELRAYVVFVKPPPIPRMRQTRKHATIITSYYVNRPFKEEDFQEVEEDGTQMESQYGHLFDYVLVNDRLQDSLAQLLLELKRLQEEPEWMPASWALPTNDRS